MVKKLASGIIVVICAFLLGLATYLLIIFAGDYMIDEEKLVLNETTTIVDENDRLITKLFVENRELVAGTEIPKHVKEAFIATEDARFHDHYGIDIKAILRALYRDILAGGKVEGGSTITQQLAKRVFLSDDKTFLRKTKEVLIAMNLERKYSKEKILELYLNQIYFGHGAYGIQSAANRFFNKDVSELSVTDGALLAAIPKAPSTYSPLVHPETSKERRNLVLSLMTEQGYLDADEAVRLQGKTLGLDANEMVDEPAYLTYIDMVLDEAESIYQLSPEEVLKGGYRIVVAMDAEAQKTAFELFQNGDFFQGSHPDERPEGAFVAMDGESGGVIAAIGGREYVARGFNRVKAKRQPGSALKPLAVYGPALETGHYEPYSLLQDKPHNYNGYEPTNYDGIYRGDISLYDALVHSTNAPAVWLLNKLGVDTIKKPLKELGLEFKDSGLKIALGGIDEGLSPFAMMKAYRAFLQAGKVVEPYVIAKIYDQNGKLIGEAKRNEKTVFSPQTAWFMTRMLEDVVREGTAKAGDVKTALAGKTGTTAFEKVEGGNRDAWFVGYTPEIVGAVWLGYDKTDEEHYLTGGSKDAVRLMKAFVNEYAGKTETAFAKPEGVHDLEAPIRLVDVNDLTGGYSLKYGLPAITLSWTPARDDRIVYRIYAKTRDGKKLEAEVTGKGRYTANTFSFFSQPDYMVVPYNPQTKQEGNPSNIVKLKDFTDLLP